MTPLEIAQKCAEIMWKNDQASKGLGMRLDSAQSVPWMMTLGAIKDDNLIYDFGVEVARQLKELGVHINFSPSGEKNAPPS